MTEQQEAGRVIPSHAQLERAISSVTGVISADVSQTEPGGRSRLRIRIAPGEDAEAVSWAVAATLRERFGIALDPDQIRPRAAEPARTDGASTDPVRLVEDGEDERAEEAARESPAATGDVPAPGELADTRDRLTSAAQEALDGLHSRFGGGRRGSDVRPERTPTAHASDALFDSASASVSSPADPVPHASMAGPEDDRSRAETGRATSSPPPPESEPPHREFAMSETGSETTGPGVGRQQQADAPVGARRTAAVGGPAAATSATSRGPMSANMVGSDRHRAAIRHLDTQRDPQDVRVTATLEHSGRSVDGTAIAVATGQGVLRAVAEATVDALRLLTGSTLLVGVDRVTVQPASDPATATVVVTLLSERGEETLLGASVVRGDPERAVMRATLDALNRRIAVLLEPA